MADALSNLDALSGLLLATSLAAERFVTIVKTLIPQLAVENTSPGQAAALVADRPRRVVVLVLALIGSYLTLALVSQIWNPASPVKVGTASYPLAVLAFLGSSGSAFWTGVVGYVKQVKDVNEAKKQEIRLNNVAKAQSMNISITADEAQGKTIQ